MKVQNPQQHHGHTIVSPGVAPGVKVQAGAGVRAPLEADDHDEPTHGDYGVPSALGNLDAELENLFAKWGPVVSQLLGDLRRRPFADRLETMVIALATGGTVAPGELIETAVFVVDGIDAQALAREPVEPPHTTPAPTSGPDDDDEEDGGR